ncbi:MAG TPA: universal stress protein [Verrucomicrobiae bacterium]|nr:universal stress protein [Verrucomicrobiae bacterium]
MFSKILVATDLSKASEEVVCSLSSLKVLGTRQALLLECLNVRDVGGLAGALIEESRPALELQKDKIAALGFETDAKVVAGLPQIEINRQADEHDCSLIVIGSRGATPFRELLLGSVASAVIHHSTRPVLVLRVDGGPVDVHAEPCQPRDCDYRRSVLFPTDFSDNAESAYRYVREIATRGAGRITLLHVLTEHCGVAEARNLAEARLERLRDDLQKRGAQDVRVELVEGSVRQEVVVRARQSEFSLVVIGSQGQGFIPGAVLGSVSHAVAYQATVPVLFVPLPR